MTQLIPPELLSPEDREARVDWLQHRIAREWLRYAITEVLLLGVPTIVVLTLWTTERTSDTTAIILFIAGCAVLVTLFVYTFYVRMGAVRKELAALQRYQAVGVRGP
jgi:ABC-type uncharacterized transport system permease subunit